MPSPVTHISRSVPTLITVGEEFDALPTAFSFNSDDPFAVTLTSTSVQGETKWVFARELLRDGLSAQTGEGDIRIHPDSGAVVLDLSSPSGSARLECSRHSIEVFLSDIYTAVPEGSEYQPQSLDRWLAELIYN